MQRRKFSTIQSQRKVATQREIVEDCRQLTSVHQLVYETKHKWGWVIAFFAKLRDHVVPVDILWKCRGITQVKHGINYRQGTLSLRDPTRRLLSWILYGQNDAFCYFLTVFDCHNFWQQRYNWRIKTGCSWHCSETVPFFCAFNIKFLVQKRPQSVHALKTGSGFLRRL